MKEALVDEVATKLYAEARRRLLKNAPLRGESAEGRQSAESLSVGELTALESVSLSTEPFEKPGVQDPLMQSIGDYMALLETSYGTSEAAQYLKVDASRIPPRLREHSLFGLDYDGEQRLPRFQFERQQVIPGLREVIAALPEGLSPLEIGRAS